MWRGTTFCPLRFAPQQFRLCHAQLSMFNMCIIGANITSYVIEKKERQALVKHHIVELESQKMAWHSKRDRALLLRYFCCQ